MSEVWSENLQCGLRSGACGGQVFEVLCLIEAEGFARGEMREEARVVLAHDEIDEITK